MIFKSSILKTRPLFGKRTAAPAFRRFSSTEWNLKSFFTPARVVGGGIFSAIVGLFGVYPYLKEFKRDVGELLEESIPPALKKARITTSPSENRYVSRPGLEAQISSFMTAPSLSKYCVVYGAKGVGKSDIIIILNIHK